MKHMVYIKPSKEFLDYFEACGFTAPSTAGFHSTLLVFDPKDEFSTEGFLGRLEDIEFEPFSVKPGNYELFDRKSHVLRISGEELITLHWSIEEEIGNMGGHKDNYHKQIGRYFLNNYNPHITVARGDEALEVPSVEMPKTMEVTTFYAARKEAEVWRELATFHASR